MLTIFFFPLFFQNIKYFNVNIIFLHLNIHSLTYLINKTIWLWFFFYKKRILRNIKFKNIKKTFLIEFHKLNFITEKFKTILTFQLQKHNTPKFNVFEYKLFKN